MCTTIFRMRPPDPRLGPGARTGGRRRSHRCSSMFARVPGPADDGRGLTDDVYSWRHAWLTHDRVGPQGIGPHRPAERVPLPRPAQLLAVPPATLLPTQEALTVEYLVTMTTRVPDGTSEDAVDAIRTREAACSRELASQGHLLRLWRPPLKPGEWSSLGLFAAADDDELERVLASMPLRVWRTDEVTPGQTDGVRHLASA